MGEPIPLTCSICGTTFSGDPRQRTCSPECSSARRAWTGLRSAAAHMKKPDQLRGLVRTLAHLGHDLGKRADEIEADELTAS